jgi:hypothetical protein
LSGGGGQRISGWLARINPKVEVDSMTLTRVTYILRAVVFLLLIGHGWLNGIEKKSLLSQYSSLGFSNPVNIARAVGIFEFIAAFSVLIRPFRSILFVLIIWKIAAELFYPHYGLFEWVERGGSYGALLALFFALDSSPSKKIVFEQMNIGG